MSLPRRVPHLAWNPRLPTRSGDPEQGGSPACSGDWGIGNGEWGIEAQEAEDAQEVEEVKEVEEAKEAEETRKCKAMEAQETEEAKE